MTVTAYDSANPVHIPADAAAVLTYSDGRYRWSHTRFPNAMWRTITVQGNPASDICDVEPGCVWPPARVVDWARQRRAEHHADITIYVNRSIFTEVRDEMRNAGITWSCILSTLDGSKPETYDGMQLRGVQYTDRNGLYDETLIYDDHWLLKPL